MSTDRDESPPLFELEKPAEGVVAAAVRVQIEKLRELGYIEDHHAGQCALALAMAEDVDRSRSHGAPSGRANLYRALGEVLELLPHPEAASSDQLQSVLDAIGDNAEDDVLVDLEHEPQP